MQVLPIILLALAPPTGSGLQSQQPDQTVQENPAVANVLDLRIQAVIAAAEADDEVALERALTDLLAIVDLLAEQAAESGSTEAIESLQSLRGWSLWELGRIDEADAAFELAGPAYAREFGYLRFRHDLAWEQEEWEKIVEILEADAKVAETGSAIVNDYNDAALTHLRSELGFGEANGRIAEILIRTDWGATRPPGERDWIYLFALHSRHESGDESGVRDAISLMRNPTYIVDALLDPDLADYHAQIEALHGTDLGRAALSINAELAALWEQRRTDPEYLLNYLISLRGLGRWQEIADRFSPIVDELQVSLAGGNTDHFLVNADGFFVVNYLVDAELRLDRYATAIERMDAILALGLDDHPDLINQAINRLEMPLQVGDYSAALEAAATLENVPDTIVAPYGRMLIRSGAACAAHLSGDSRAALEWRDRLLEMDNVGSIVELETYLCLEDFEAAERHVLECMQDGSALSMRSYFQQRALWEPRGEYDRMIKQRADALLERPQIRAAIDAAGGVRVFALAHLSA